MYVNIHLRYFKYPFMKCEITTITIANRGSNLHMYLIFPILNYK